MELEDWGSGLDECVAVFLNGESIPAPDERGERVVDESLLLCFNASDEIQHFVTPDGDYARQWVGALDTAHPAGETTLEVVAGQQISLQPRSLLVLRKTA